MRFIILVLVFFGIGNSVYGENNESSETTEEVTLPVEYVSLGSDVVVNLQGRRKYLRTGMQLMVEGTDNVEKINIHNPAIRHAMIMLFSQFSPDQLLDPGQREELRKLALEDIRKSLEKYSSSTGLKDLFFTEFLVH